MGGGLLLGAAVLAFVLANSPFGDAYRTISGTVIGFSAINLEMSIAHWASDAVLAIFFFVVGLELKREFVTGSLRDPRKVGLPILAAVGGMAVPALVYAIVVATAGVDALQGWAIPVATDIAFALALLAVFGKGLPSPFRTFLLTLAVMDDLLAIIVIAIFYTTGLSLLWLIGSLVAIAAYWFMTHRGVNSWWLAIPLAVFAWYCMYQSGVHATISAVLLGLSVPAKPIGRDEISLAEDMEHDWNALSQGFALPVFAFFSAGVPIAASGGSVLDSIADPVFLGVFLGLLIGKPLGIFLTVLVLHRLPLFRLDSLLNLKDIAALGWLAGIGFTVSLLIGELAFRGDPAHVDTAHLGVLFGSIAAALVGTLALRIRVRAHRSDELSDDKAVLP